MVKSQTKIEPLTVIFETAKVPTVRERVAKIFGFTDTGTSVLGKIARKLLPKNGTRRIAGATLFLAGLIFIGISLIPKNIGGTLAFNPTYEPPLIDVTTQKTTQIPIDYVYESRGFSWFHSGADLAAPVGTPVKPIMVGVVKEIHEDNFGYGIHVIVDHENRYISIYGHMSQIFVVPGQKVFLSTILGRSGNTGFSTGPHLHLEVRLNDIAINPTELVSGIK